MIAGRDFPESDSGRRQLSGAGSCSLDGPGQRSPVPYQEVDIAAKDKFVDRVFLEGTAQKNSADSTRQWAEPQEVHVDAGEYQGQGAEIVVIQGQEKNESC